jgi:hypothetical protein
MQIFINIEWINKLWYSKQLKFIQQKKKDWITPNNMVEIHNIMLNEKVLLYKVWKLVKLCHDSDSQENEYSWGSSG